MIRSNIRLLMAEQRISSVAELMKKSGLSRGVLDKVYHDKNLEQIQLSSLIALSKTFGVKIDDLIQIVDEESEKLNDKSNEKEPH